MDERPPRAAAGAVHLLGKAVLVADAVVIRVALGVVPVFVVV